MKSSRTLSKPCAKTPERTYYAAQILALCAPSLSNSRLSKRRSLWSILAPMALAMSKPRRTKQTAAAVADLAISSLRLSSSDLSPQVEPWQVLLKPPPRLKETRGAATEEVGGASRASREEEGPSSTVSNQLIKSKYE